MFYRFASSIILLCLGEVPYHASAQEPLKPFEIPDGTPADSYPVSGWMETVFQSQVRQCNNSVNNIVLQKGKKTKNVSFIPIPVVNYLDLQKKRMPLLPSIVRVHSGYPVAQEFIYVFVKDGNNRVFARNSLAITIAEANPRSPLPSFSGAEYNVSCAQSISAAAKAKGGYSLPLVSIEAALEGGTAAATSYNLQFIDGTFYSPLVAMWLGRTPDAQLPVEAVAQGKLYSILVFWNWRAANPDLTSAEILERFHGIAVYEQTSMRSSSSINSTMKAGLALPFLQGESSTQVSKSRNSTFASNANQVAIFTDDLGGATGLKYFNIPSVDELVQSANRIIGFTLIQSIAPVSLFDEKPVTLTYQAAGMPTTYCQAMWSVSVDGLKGHVSVSGVNINKQSGACDISVTYAPTTAEVRTGLTLHPRFTLIEPISGKLISFLAEDAYLTTASRPRVVPTWFQPPVAQLSADNKYSLSVEYQLDDNNMLLASNSKEVRHLEMQVVCPGASSIAIPSFDLMRKDIIGNVLKVAVSFDATDEHKDAAKSLITCTLAGSLELHIRSNSSEAWIPRQIPATEFYLRTP